MPANKKTRSTKKDEEIEESYFEAKEKHSFGGAMLLLVVLLIVAIGGFVWSFTKYQKVQKQVAHLATQEGQLELAEKEAEELLTMVSKLILLPVDEDPVIATIIDADALKQQQDFYVDAVNDDKLIIYKQKAIIYSPSRNIIVNVGPVFIQEGDQLINPAVSENSQGDLEVTEKIEETTTEDGVLGGTTE